MTKTLTKATFAERSAALEHGIELAESRLAEAAFEQSTGTGTADDVEQARKHANALREQLDSLGMAWSVTEKANAAALGKSQKAAWGDALKGVDKLLAEREVAATSMQRAAKAMGEAYASFRRANDDMVALLHPLALNMDGFRTVRDAIAASHFSPATMIAGTLAWYDIDFSGINVLAAKHAIKQRDLPQIAVMLSTNVRSAITAAPFVGKE